MVYIIIVNWNGWRDTIECLESLFRLEGADYRVIVCDNGSKDNSLEYIKDWATGDIKAEVNESNPLRHLTSPPIFKPIPYVVYDRNLKRCGDNAVNHESRLVLIDIGDNLGFAGGCNVGLRYALSQDDLSFVWLLNNDTVVEPDALRYLAQAASIRPKAGICGSTLLHYDQPEKVQALGGCSYNKWFGFCRSVGSGQSAATLRKSKIKSKLDYIAGASMFVSKEFLDNTGLMCEEYFLYFEELDWVCRGSDGFEYLYVPESIVYHKEGQSTGGKNNRVFDKSRLSDYCFVRSKILVARKFFPYTLPTIYLGLLVTLINRVRRRQWDRVLGILKLAAGNHSIADMERNR